MLNTSKMFFKLFTRTCTREKRYIKQLINYCYFHIDSAESMLNVSASHVKQVLKQQSSPIIDGYTCVMMDCLLCDNPKKGSKLYVNKTTGFFMCEKCKYSGSWDILAEFLSIHKSAGKLTQLQILRSNFHREENFIKTWENIKKNCQAIIDLSTDEYNMLLNNFLLPRVTQEDMHRLDCMYDKIYNVLHIPLTGLDNFIVGYKSLKTDSNAEITVPASAVSGCIIFKQRNIKSDDTAVIVGTIHDMLALISQKSANTIICLPYNLKSLPQQLLPYLESFTKLTLWFGNDDASWSTARQFARKLNEKRCYFVKPTDLQPRPKLAADMGYDLKSILQNAQSMWHKSITTFQQLREDLLSDLQNIDKVQGVKWKKYPTLNRVLKGHRRGEFTILTGPTGCGKTTFVSEYSLDLAMQGVNTLWGSFEIRNVRLVKTMLQQMVGKPLDENLENFDTYADAFEKLPIYFMTFHGQETIKVVMDAVEHATYVHDIAHVVIDNVQFMIGTSDGSKHMDRFWKQDDIIARFRNFATKYNCHVTAIIHPRKERNDEELTTSSIFGSAKASQEADNVLIIQDKRLTSIRGRKYLQVAKNRYSGDLGIMVLDFDKSSLSYAPKGRWKSEKIEKEKSVTNKQSVG